ncbi:MAG TPA: hypothetical protein ENN56_03395 [Firmicutes bacterium]|nr:hypothetical protein [Bacillota bacterium]
MRQSRVRLFVSIAIVVVSTAIFATAGILIDRRLIGVLDARLGDALESQARTIATTIIIPPNDDPVSLALIVEDLTTARIASDAQLVVLFDRFGTVIAADPPALGAEPYLRLDNTALAIALTGDVSAGERYQIGGQDLKSAFAPVTGPFGDVVGVIGIEAPADYFGALRDVRAALVLTLGIGMALVIGLTLVVWRFWERSERSERAIFRAQQLATIGQMTATMAHEVRNPLSIIRATAERIKRKYSDGDEIFDFIPEEIDRLDRLTRWYLDFARPSEATVTAVDLRNLVLESLSRVRKEIEAAGIEVDVADTDAPVMVAADRDRLLQAILNIVINAIEAMPDGGRIDGRILIRGDRARLEIRDSGPGIDAEVHASVFEPFVTTKTTGSGLGLAVVRQVVESLLGRVGIESETGVGTTVWIELPLAKPS